MVPLLENIIRTFRYFKIKYFSIENYHNFFFVFLMYIFIKNTCKGISQ